MKKQILTALFILFSIVTINAQRQDSVAFYLLDRMSYVISDLNSFSFDIVTTYDVDIEEVGLVKNSNRHSIKVKGPYKMNLISKGDKGHKGFWFSDSLLHYYSFDTNNYGSLEAPGTIMDMIKLVHENYGIEIPGADFWYRGLTDDLITDFPNIYYLGMTEVNEKNCFHIIASNENLRVQIWISDDLYFLPKKMVVTYLSEAGAPQYEAIYSNWKLNEPFPESIFDFITPPRSHKIIIKELNEAL
jgi:hypothetical protein